MFVIGVVHIVLQTVKMSGVCSAVVYGTVHYKEPLKMLGHSPDFRLSSVLILS